MIIAAFYIKGYLILYRPAGEVATPLAKPLGWRKN
jgi:hypothetical protein